MGLCNSINRCQLKRCDLFVKVPKFLTPNSQIIDNNQRPSHCSATHQFIRVHSSTLCHSFPILYIFVCATLYSTFDINSQVLPFHFAKLHRSSCVSYFIRSDDETKGKRKKKQDKSLGSSSNKSRPKVCWFFYVAKEICNFWQTDPFSRPPIRLVNRNNVYDA